MTKDKIVINVPMHNDKAKSKAMMIAVARQGVMTVNIGGENDRLEVIGEGVDSVGLVNSLRKKFCFADIINQEGIKPESSSSSCSDSSRLPPPPPPPPPYYQPPPPPYCQPPPPPYYQPLYYESWVYDAPPPNCSIL